MEFVDAFFAVFIIIMFGQGLLTMLLSLYIWEDPSRIEASASPKTFIDPLHSFTVLIPAKEEQAVIARTLQKISQINYPRELYEVFVVCDRSDDATIIETRRAMQVLEMRNGFTLTFGDTPVNKPHGLNKGLKYATKDHIVIFDAEDDVHPDVLNIANTLYGTTNTDVIQAGVQIVDYTSHWYSSHYVLEYYFWFKSRMHFHSSIKMVPLGGNTVFFKTALLREAGGWDETCLTEDAEIGIRLSSLDARIMATYDPRHVTKEETPPSIAQFIKQRTRWNQGFIQILRSKVWRIYPNRLQRIMCYYTLAYPFIQSALFILTLIVISLSFFFRLPLVIGLLSFMPGLLLGLLIIVYQVGLHEFIKEQKLKQKRLVYLTMLVTFIPYQFLLVIGAMRATYREMRGINNWEKTAHLGQHYNLEGELSMTDLGMAN